MKMIFNTAINGQESHQLSLFEQKDKFEWNSYNSG